ncbi:hypothetical protein BGZ83_003332 [Gryganskiella cystojenkinii]|nr:hypothetical protein BGZ83_003332 [Gryganskiella cystojenkinii]
MSQAKHLHTTILRGRGRGQQLLQQLHHVATPSSHSSASASSCSVSCSFGPSSASALSSSSSSPGLRLLPSRPVAVGHTAGTDSVSSSASRLIHTQSHSQQPAVVIRGGRGAQQQYSTLRNSSAGVVAIVGKQQHYSQHSLHSGSCHHHNVRTRHRGPHAGAMSACLLHTSAHNSALASPTPAESAAAAASLNSSSASSISTGTSTISTAAGTAAASSAEGAHVFKEQTTSSSLAWASELPWIDPHTLESFLDPSHIPASTAIPTTTTSSFFDQPFQNTRHNFVFAHGASGFAKHPSKQPTLTPEEDRAYFSVQVGEDSYFRRHDALGVADGANPALYSRKLMHYAFLELEKYDNIEEDAFYDYFNVNPVHILQKSYEQSARDAKKEGLIGSSTACLAILRDDELRIANLGDCGVSIIRRNEFIFRTEEQQHSFNYPYQLGTGSTDSPTDAQVFTVKVESGDIIVMGTDGIFDNLFDEDILEEVVRCVNGANVVQNHSPYGTGKQPSSTTTTSTGFSGKGIWSGLTSGAAKLASSSSSTIAAMAGAKATVVSEPAVAPFTTAENESLASLLQGTDGSEPVPTPLLTPEAGAEAPELSPIALAAVAAAASSALPPSASLYPLSTPTSSAAAIAAAEALERKQQYERKIPEPSVISEALAKRAKNVSEDTRHHGSPFQSRAMQEGLYYQGGKQDDMSVLVAIIKVAEDSPDRR